MTNKTNTQPTAEKVKNKDLKMVLLVAAFLATLVALYAGIQTMFWPNVPEGMPDPGTDLFHGIPAVACAGFCAFLAGRALFRLHNRD